MNKRMKRFLRAVSLMCAAALMTVSATDWLRPSVAAENESSYRSELAELEAEEERLNEQIAEKKDDLDAQQEVLDALNEKIENQVSQITVLTNQIDAIDARIAEKEQEIADKEAAIDAREKEIKDDFAKLQERLRAISKSGNMSTLQMLLDNTEYTDYLIKSKMMQRIAQNDQDLMDTLEKEIQKIQADKEKIEKEKATIDKEREEVAAIKAQADAKKAELDDLYAQANSVAQQLRGSIADYESQLSENQARREEVESDLQDFLRRQAAAAAAAAAQGGDGDGSAYGGSYGGGLMSWPVPAVHNISSGYGYRWGTVHRGIDIANGAVPVYGQDIVAAADGQVIYVNNSDSWGSGISWGYGYCVIIDHGNDEYGNHVTTLYAHCSAVYAYVGQEVTGGSTVIASAGNTGDVTGPHLHFEVRLNGSAVDPFSNGYLSM